MNTVYPLKFTPILKEKIWGGTKLKTILQKDTTASNLGESWELSDVDGDVSIVSNGFFKGKSLKELIKEDPIGILGSKNYERFGAKFPLLIKFIDAAHPLSVQLHPDDDLAKSRHNSFGKTEMWYVMQADNDGNLIVGFNQPMDKGTYLKHLNDKSLTDILNTDSVKEGDTYFIEAGRIHAIGAGVMLAEIQQTSDVTYRVYDWDRVDDDGNARELHNDIAIDAFKFELQDDFRITYSKEANQPNEMVNCPYFTTNFLKLDTDMEVTNDFDSFIIYMCVDGQASISIDTKMETISKGETLLIPASAKNHKVATDFAKMLQIYI